MANPLKSLKVVRDGLMNFTSRLGTSADKASHGHYSPNIYHNQLEIDAAYRTTWFKKIVNIPAEDAIREGVAWQAEDEQITKINAECERLNLWPKILMAKKLARKDGNSAIYMGGLAGLPAEPADIETVVLGGLTHLTVFQRHEISPGEQERDILNERYGKAKWFTIAGQRVDPSRIIWFRGNERFGIEWDGYDDSMWTVIRTAVRNSDQIANGIAALVEEARVGVMKIKGFMDGMATKEYEDQMVKRMESVKLLQSIVSDKIIDSEDDYQFLSTNFAGFPDIQDRALQIMCAIADIPATRFLGQSPGGLNSTGESDLRNYYDAVATHQTMDIDPLIDPLMDAVVLSALGTNGDEIDYVWNSLWQMSETEAATVEKSYADGLAVRVNTGLFDNAILAKTELNRMTDSGKYPGIDAAIKASGEEDGILDPEEAEAKEIEKMTMEAEIAAKNAPKPAPGGFPPKKK